MVKRIKGGFKFAPEEKTAASADWSQVAEVLAQLEVLIETHDTTAGDLFDQYAPLLRQ